MSTNPVETDDITGLLARDLQQRNIAGDIHDARALASELLTALLPEIATYVNDVTVRPDTTSAPQRRVVTELMEAVLASIEECA